MYNSGDAAEQIVRISLEGTEVALKLTGSAAKNIAAMLYAVLKNRDKNKTKGRQRLTAMLKSGKELKVFTVSEEHLKQFATEAKRYGVVYCALRGKEKSADGMVDIMVRAEDASKINRIVERFKLAAVNAASIQAEIRQSREEHVNSDKTAFPAEQEQTQPLKSETEQDVGYAPGAPVQKEDASPNPFAAKAEKSPASAPTCKQPNRVGEDMAESAEHRPSVRRALQDIQARRRKSGQSQQKPVVKKPHTRSHAHERH